MYCDLTEHLEEAPLNKEIDGFLQKPVLRHHPFEDILLEFCQELSKKIIKDPDPDLSALGFWLRAAQINELKKRFESIQSPSTILVPRGLAFHITASNVDTLFAYSWILSLLVGNSNLIKLPSKQSPAINQLLTYVRKIMENNDFKTISSSNCLLRYNKQDVITKSLSLKSDVRLIWGSNTTVDKIRAFPLNPYAKEIIFPDRFSYAALSAEEYLASGEDTKTVLSQAFFRDTYGFDQHGCSSPRLIFWIGSLKLANEASSLFYLRLKEEIERRNYRLPLSVFLRKQTEIYALAAARSMESFRQLGNELSILDLKKLPPTAFDHPGGGLFYHVRALNLNQIEHFASSRDQTLTYFGFNQGEILGLAKQLNGRGPSRIVPIGEALNFDSSWDGYDVLQELTRCISIHLPSKD